MKTKQRLLRITAIFAAVLMSVTVMAAEPVSKSGDGDVAIGGHDTVAYHSLERAPQEKAVSGEKTYVVEYKGAKWRFADKASADKFAAEPDKYTPAYNGHCANALSIGNGLVKTDGTHWEIFGDQLYLFFAARGRTRWTEGQWQSFKVDADTAWEKLK